MTRTPHHTYAPAFLFSVVAAPTLYTPGTVFPGAVPPEGVGGGVQKAELGGPGGGAQAWVPPRNTPLPFKATPSPRKGVLSAVSRHRPSLGPGGLAVSRRCTSLSTHALPTPPWAALRSSQVGAEIFLVALFPFWEGRKIQSEMGTLVIQKDFLYI